MHAEWGVGLPPKQAPLTASCALTQRAADVALGVVGRQRLLIAGLEDGRLLARLVGEEVGAAHAVKRLLRLLARLEAADNGLDQAADGGVGVRGAANLHVSVAAGRDVLHLKHKTCHHRPRVRNYAIA